MLRFFWNDDEARIDRIAIIKKAKKDLEEKACLDSNSQGDAHNPLSVANIFKERRVEETAEFKHTDDQKLILDAVEKKIQPGELQPGEQMLFFAHGAAAAGK